MRVKWMMLNLGAALCLASLGGTAEAQERPAPEPGAVTTQPDGAGGDLDAPAMDGMDGLEVLLAADVAGGPGQGPGEAMGEAGMGPGGRRGPGMRRGPGGVGMEALREKLNLSEDQTSKLADIRDRQARAAIPIEGDLRIAGLDLRKLMRADRPNQQAIDSQIDRMAALRARLQKARVASMLEARSVLTPAQQKLMREHGGGLMGRGRHGGRGGPGMNFMDDPMARRRR
jgi:Spy/CpxP family protein refolding chaperone